MFDLLDNLDIGCWILRRFCRCWVTAAAQGTCAGLAERRFEAIGHCSYSLGQGRDVMRLAGCPPAITCLCLILISTTIVLWVPVPEARPGDVTHVSLGHVQLPVEHPTGGHRWSARDQWLLFPITFDEFGVMVTALKHPTKGPGKMSSVKTWVYMDFTYDHMVEDLTIVFFRVWEATGAPTLSACQHEAELNGRIRYLRQLGWLWSPTISSLSLELQGRIRGPCLQLMTFWPSGRKSFGSMGWLCKAWSPFGKASRFLRVLAVNKSRSFSYRRGRQISRGRRGPFRSGDFRWPLVDGAALLLHPDCLVTSTETLRSHWCWLNIW